MKNILRLLSVVSVTLMPLMAQASALDDIKAAGVIRFGLTASYPPFADKTPDGKLIGADVAEAYRVAALIGVKPEFVMTTWPTLVADFSSGKFDVTIGGLTVNPEREAVGTFSVMMLDDGKRPLARCADKDRYATIADIDRPGVRVMINRGPMMAEFAKQWFAHTQVEVHLDDATLIDQLLQNKVDVWVTDGVVIDQMARRFAGQLCVTTDKPFNHVTKAWLIRNDPALVAAVNKGLTAALVSGEWKREMDSYN